MRMLSPTARERLPRWTARPPPRPTRDALGEVDAERRSRGTGPTTGITKKPDDAEHGADHQGRGGDAAALSCLPGSRYFTTEPTASRTTRDGEHRPGRGCRRSRWPRPGSRRGSAACRAAPARTMPARPTSDGQPDERPPADVTRDHPSRRQRPRTLQVRGRRSRVSGSVLALRGGAGLGAELVGLVVRRGRRPGEASRRAHARGGRRTGARRLRRALRAGRPGRRSGRSGRLRSKRC